MAVVDEIIRSEADGTLSFGNHLLSEKAKKEDFEHAGDLYKVKTFATMTKLEKNGLFVYESVPGTTVTNLKETATEMSFTVEGNGNAQLTIGLEEDSEYEVLIDDASVGKMKTNLGGKLNISVEFGADDKATVLVRK